VYSSAFEVSVWIVAVNYYRFAGGLKTAAQELRAAGYFASPRQVPAS